MIEKVKKMKKSDFQFSNPQIEYLNFSQNDEFKPTELGVSMENSFHTEIDKSDEKNSNEAKVSLTLQLNKNNENSPFTLDIRMSAWFHWNSEISDKIDAMLNTNAPALLLGYMRPIVASITNSSKYPVYNLPFINFMSESDS